MGRRVGPGERHGLQHVAAHARAELPTSVMELADPQVERPASASPEARPTSNRSSRASRGPTARPAALRWLEAVKANAGSHDYPEQRDGHRQVNSGQVALGVINQYYWYRERAQVGPSRDCTRPSPTSPRTTSATSSTSRAPASSSPRATRSRAQRFLAFLTSAQGQEIIAHSDSYEYPIASGVTTAQPETPFDQLAAERDHDRRAGHRRRGDQAPAGGPAPVTRGRGGSRVRRGRPAPCRRC